MPRSLQLLVASTLLFAACAPAVPLSRDEAARLATAPPIAVLSVHSAPPWVDCPNDEGEKVWEGGAAVGRNDDREHRVVELSSAWAAPPPIVLASGVWRSIQDQWTEPLQVPPVDPAAATAAQLLSRVGAAGIPLPLAGPAEEVQRLDRAALRGRFPESPVLVVEAVRWVLVGCFFTYQPWFNVRATLLRPSTGEILWRDTCNGAFPGGSPAPASRDELTAGNGSLYARIIQERAAACATQLVAGLAGAGRI